MTGAPEDPAADRLRALARGLVGGSARIGLCRVGSAGLDDLFHVERSAVAGAVAVRQAEFAAGRVAAREALGRAQPLPVSADRAPIWPEGIVGSITHAGGWALAAVGVGGRGLGIDLEQDADLPAEILDTVLRPEERGCPLRQARVIFSIKEAAFKAQWPLTRRLFGFEMFRVRLSGPSFRAEFMQPLGPFRAGDAIGGNWGRAEGMILSVALL